MTTRTDIEQVLWNGANTFRGIIGASTYKDYLLPLLFVKYLSDIYEENIEELKKKYPNKERFERAKERLPFKLQEKFSFKSLYAQKNLSTIGEKINEALRGIEDDNQQYLQGIFRSVDFNSTANLGEQKDKITTLKNLLEDFNSLDLRPSQIEVKEGQVPSDVLGDAFEYMIGQFAQQAGAKAGSFFTPMGVAELMARIANPKAGQSVYDPTAGSSSLIIRTAKKAGVKNVAIYGQERDASSWAMSKMNMFIHDISDAKLALGDTLSNPQHLDDDGNLMKFDVIVANMPFSLDKWAEGFNPGGEEESSDKDKKKSFQMEASLDRFNRFSYGVPPKTKGDWAFLLHMIASLNNNGTIVAVAPHGVLFRGASEGQIRKKVIDNNLLDAVIGLPSNLFFGTSIPAALLIFKKNRKNKDILFIDASGETHYKKEKKQNVLLEENISEIYSAYKNRKDIEKFAHVASITEIKDNEYNLNIPRYVDTFEEEKEVDIKAVKKEINDIEKQLKDVDEQMKKYLKELGL